VTVGGALQGLESLHVVVNLDVGGIPDGLVAGGALAELLDELPVVLAVELVAVTPDEEAVEEIEEGKMKIVKNEE